MINKYIVEIDTKKLKKELIVPGRSYELKDGTKYTPNVLETEFIIQDSNKHKKLYDNDNSALWKVGFAVQKTKKDEDTIYIGDVKEWRKKITGDQMAAAMQQQADTFGIEIPKDDINPEDIPF